jgi:Ankyrin repeats (3 copies)/Ankyrin repeat
MVIMSAKVRLPEGQWFRKYMNTLGYKISYGGSCYGLAQMSRQAFLSGEIDKFNKRLISIYSKGESYFKKLKKGEIKTKESIDILAFFDGVVLYQNPVVNRAFLPTKDKGFDGKWITQRDNVAHDVVAPVTKEKQIKAFDFSGAYSKSELIKILQLFQHNIKNKSSFQISNNGHAMSIQYDPQKKEWHFIDANQLPVKTYKQNELSKFASIIIKGFKCKRNGDDNAIFSASVYANKDDSTQLAQSFSKIKKTSEWQQIHKVTQKKSNMRALKKDSWILVAAKGGNVSDVKKLLDFKHPKSVVEDVYNIARKNWWLKVLEKLIKENKIDINQTKFGRTMLYDAIIDNASLKIIEFLIKMGADVNSKTDDDLAINRRTPLDIAIFRNRTKVLECLLPKANQETKNQALIYAIVYDKPNYEKLLIENGAKFNKKLLNRELMTRITYGDKKAVKRLLKKGADIKQLMKNGENPLYLAAENGHCQLFKTLFKYAKGYEEKMIKGALNHAKKQGANHAVYAFKSHYNEKGQKKHFRHESNEKSLIDNALFNKMKFIDTLKKQIETKQWKVIGFRGEKIKINDSTVKTVPKNVAQLYQLCQKTIVDDDYEKSFNKINQMLKNISVRKSIFSTRATSTTEFYKSCKQRFKEIKKSNKEDKIYYGPATLT